MENEMDQRINLHDEHEDDMREMLKQLKMDNLHRLLEIVDMNTIDIGENECSMAKDALCKVLKCGTYREASNAFYHFVAFMIAKHELLMLK